MTESADCSPWARKKTESVSIEELFAPMAENAMTRHRGRVIARGHDKFAALQSLERKLDGAFGESGCVSKSARTQRKRFPFITRSHPVEIKINKIRGRLL